MIDPLEGELRAALHARADDVRAAPDLVWERTRRRATVTRRRRVASLSAGGALAVAAAVGLGTSGWGPGLGRVVAAPPADRPAVTTVAPALPTSAGALDPDHPWRFRGSNAVRAQLLRDGAVELAARRVAAGAVAEGARTDSVVLWADTLSDAMDTGAVLLVRVAGGPWRVAVVVSDARGLRLVADHAWRPTWLVTAALPTPRLQPGDTSDVAIDLALAPPGSTITVSPALDLPLHDRSVVLADRGLAPARLTVRDRAGTVRTTVTTTTRTDLSAG